MNPRSDQTEAEDMSVNRDVITTTVQTTLAELVRSDIAAWGDLWAGDKRRPGGDYGLAYGLWLFYSFCGFRAGLLYRLSHAAHQRGLHVLPQLLAQLNIMLHGIDIPASVPIGPRLYIPHPVGTTVMAQRIGSDLTLVSGITIGMRNELAFPTIGDNVFIGAGARVLGGITVGSNVKIGANAVVLRDVPEHSVALGVPAVIRSSLAD
ncbi:MAG: serine O-acetyltransferase [Chloroflexota bacterium]